ncbi:manganese efflux pump [Cohnella sp. LGH]|nr:manganese efflux pump [Cohnella sp. LGH]
MEKMFAWILTMSLGFDTLVVSASLGLKKETRNKVKIALVFAAAEAVMPIAGIVIGGALGHMFRSAASLIGSLLLIAVAIYFLFFDDEGEEGTFHAELAGWPLIAAAVSISIDELAVGVSAGFMQVPMLLTILLIASRSFVFTFIGVTFAAKLKPIMGEWAEKCSGVLLGLIGLWMLLESF